MIDVKMMAEKLVKLRGKRTQAEVAAAVGISQSALAAYETGDRVPRDEIKVRLANYYKRSIGFIFFNVKDHDMKPETNEEARDEG